MTQMKLKCCEMTGQVTQIGVLTIQAPCHEITSVGSKHQMASSLNLALWATMYLFQPRGRHVLKCPSPKWHIFIHSDI